MERAISVLYCIVQVHRVASLKFRAPRKIVILFELSLVQKGGDFMTDRACSDNSQHLRLDSDTEFPFRDTSYPRVVDMLEWKPDSPQAYIA